MKQVSEMVKTEVMAVNLLVNGGRKDM